MPGAKGSSLKCAVVDIVLCRDCDRGNESRLIERSALRTSSGGAEIDLEIRNVSDDMRNKVSRWGELPINLITRIQYWLSAWKTFDSLQLEIRRLSW